MFFHSLKTINCRKYKSLSMKIFILSLIILLSIINNISFAENKDNYILSNEITEWSIISAIFGISIWQAIEEPYFDKALIDSPYTDRINKGTDILSNSLLVSLPILTFSTIGFAKNENGYLNYLTYKNIKGISEAFTANLLITTLSKNIFSRKRPYYENDKSNHESRKSFISGHTSISFNAVTYFNLYIWQHIGTNDNPFNISSKIVLSLTTYSAASYVAYERVRDNQHFLSDVIAGGIIGSGISIFFYMLQNNYFSNIDSNQDNLLITITTNNISIGIKF